MDSGICIRGEIPKNVFFFVCDSFCGQNVDLEREEGAGGPTIARSLSCARSFSMLVSGRSLVWRERESKLEKAAGEICSSGRLLFVFLLYYKDGGQFSSLRNSWIKVHSRDGAPTYECSGFCMPFRGTSTSKSWPYIWLNAGLTTKVRV